MKITFLILSIVTMVFGFAAMGTNEDHAIAAILVVAGLAGIGVYTYLPR